MPAVFAFGLDPQSGPGLVFETLPFVFSKMPAGGLIAILFFVALLVAALTSSISMLEVAVAYLVEEKKFTRVKACVTLFVVCWVVGAFCSLSFGPLSDIKIAGRGIFDFFDNLTSNILMTLGSYPTICFGEMKSGSPKKSSPVFLPCILWLISLTKTAQKFERTKVTRRIICSVNMVQFRPLSTLICSRGNNHGTRR